MPEMECHISDGPQTPDEMPGHGGPTETCSIHGCEMDGEHCPMCEAVCVVCGHEWVDVAAGFDTCDGCTNNN